MNVAFAHEKIGGKILDIGGGHRPDYFSYFEIAEGSSIGVLDGSMTGINFESDRIPHTDESVDTVLLCNVLEHVYNYRHLLSETRRVLNKNGTLVGFVPFLVGYHPDPNDYFRYTKEALMRMGKDAGFSQTDVREVGGGPFMANFNLIVLSLPRLLRPVLYLWYAGLDYIFLSLRPGARVRVPLGFLFRFKP